jgi:hypothetical protein
MKLLSATRTRTVAGDPVSFALQFIQSNQNSIESNKEFAVIKLSRSGRELNMRTHQVRTLLWSRKAVLGLE